MKRCARDVFAKYYTPAVIALALLVFVLSPLTFGGGWAIWFYRALVLLVIASSESESHVPERPA